jgi:hypothetical protein
MSYSDISRAGKLYIISKGFRQNRKERLPA